MCRDDAKTLLTLTALDTRFQVAHSVGPIHVDHKIHSQQRIQDRHLANLLRYYGLVYSIGSAWHSQFERRTYIRLPRWRFKDAHFDYILIEK
jgi:hypothetical protein